MKYKLNAMQNRVIDTFNPMEFVDMDDIVKMLNQNLIFKNILYGIYRGEIDIESNYFYRRVEELIPEFFIGYNFEVKDE